VIGGPLRPARPPCWRGRDLATAELGRVGHLELLPPRVHVGLGHREGLVRRRFLAVGDAGQRACRATEMRRPSSTQRWPPAIESLNSWIIQSSGVSRNAWYVAASSVARVVFPAAGSPTIRTRVAARGTSFGAVTFRKAAVGSGVAGQQGEALAAAEVTG
jgi:hypothetical protein